MKTPPASNVTSPRQELVQLPIPKNLVLISLLEATLQTAEVEKRQDEDYESGDDDEQVVAGMNLLSSDFGTYVVREKNGLVVQPLSPSPSHDEDEAQAAAVERPVAKTFVLEPDGEFESFDLQDPLGVQALPTNPSSREAPSFDENRDERPVFREAESSEEQDKKPFILRYGQTVQVVSFADGVAMLARSNGYIDASDKQLVKGKFAVFRVLVERGDYRNHALTYTSLPSLLPSR